jgi:hypothetical protein
MNTYISLRALAIGSVGAVAFSALPAQALTFNGSGLTLSSQQELQFQFLGSKGQYKSTVSVYEVINGSIGAKVADLFSEDGVGYSLPTTGDFIGTVNGQITGAQKRITLKSGVYTLGLFSENIDGDSYNPVAPYTYSPIGTVYSTDALNPGGSPQAQFVGNQVWFDDRGNQDDQDFNDFGIAFQAAEPDTTAVPTPALLPGLIGLGLGAWRKRKAKSQESAQV